MVTMHAITPGRGLLGWVPSFADPPPWSLNAPCAKFKRFHGEGNPVQNGLLHCTQSGSSPSTSSGS